jgi:hypothetical protein
MKHHPWLLRMSAIFSLVALLLVFGPADAESVQLLYPEEFFAGEGWMDGSVDDIEDWGLRTPWMVDIDIKPGSYPNSINIDGHGVIPVAVLGSEDLDVTIIDPLSLNFAGLSVAVKGNGDPRCSVEDVSGPSSDSSNPTGVPDGYPDLVCQFVDDPDAWSPGNGEATLYCGQYIVGTDDIVERP